MNRYISLTFERKVSPCRIMAGAILGDPNNSHIFTEKGCLGAEDSLTYLPGGDSHLKQAGRLVGNLGVA